MTCKFYGGQRIAKRKSAVFFLRRERDSLKSLLFATSVLWRAIRTAIGILVATRFGFSIEVHQTHSTFVLRPFETFRSFISSFFDLMIRF